MHLIAGARSAGLGRARGENRSKTALRSHLVDADKYPRALNIKGGR